MKNTFKKRYSILIIFAIILSTIIVRTSTLQPASPCINTPGCVGVDGSENTGILITKTRGYPLSIQQKKTFKPVNSAHYAEASIETQGFSPISVAINAIFWFAALDLALRLVMCSKNWSRTK